MGLKPPPPSPPGSAALEGHGEELVTTTSSQPVAGHSPTLQYVAKQVLAALL